MDGELRFKIKYLKEALEFINSLPEKVQDKVTYNIGKCQTRIDPELFSKLSGSDIWEFRTLYDGIAYRLFAFWDKDDETFVVATHGLVKKSQKTPRKEIQRAEAMRELYLSNKTKKK